MSDERKATLDEAALMLMREAKLITAYAKDTESAVMVAAMLVRSLASSEPPSDACLNCGLGDAACDAGSDAGGDVCCPRCIHPWHDASLSIALFAARASS